MIIPDVLSFNSLRALALICHFFATTVLLWTLYDPVSVTLQPNFSHEQFKSSRAKYEAFIGTGLGRHII